MRLTYLSGHDRLHRQMLGLDYEEFNKGAKLLENFHAMEYKGYSNSRGFLE